MLCLQDGLPKNYTKLILPRVVHEARTLADNSGVYEDNFKVRREIFHDHKLNENGRLPARNWGSIFFSFAHFLNRVLLAPRLCDSKFCDILALQNWNGGQASSTDACRVGRPRLSAFRRNGWRETVLDFLSNWPEGLWTGRGGLS